jgi:hypothetical protein
MTTGVLGTNARQDPRQVVNTLKKTVNWNDPGVSAGVPFDNPLPQNGFITRVLVEIVAAFNAGTTNVLTVGTVGTAYNNIVAAADVNEGVVGVYDVVRGLGRALTAGGDVLPYAKYEQTGTAASAGQAIILLQFEGGWTT